MFHSMTRFCPHITIWLLLAIVFSTSISAGEPDRGTKRFPKLAIPSNMGWFKSNYVSVGYQNDTDFMVYRLTYEPKDEGHSSLGQRTLQEEQEMMAKWGWNVHAPDFLFFSDHEVKRHIGFMRSCIKAADASNQKDFWIIPMLETVKNGKINPEWLAKALAEMLDELGDNPRWVRVDGRPAILFYNAFSAPVEQWRRTRELLEASGHKAFWIFELGGLEAALKGSFDVKKARPYAELFDGVYNFGASGLVACSKFAAFYKKNLPDTKAAQYVGGTIWPGYLSERAHNRNFISQRHTAHLREVWENVLAANPNFINWSTWNDYHEHTTLACSYSVLTSQLEISKRYLSRYWNEPVPAGKADVPELVLSYRKCLYQGEPVTFEVLPLPTMNGPKTGQVTVKAYDQNGKEIFSKTSPQLDLTKMQPWNCELTAGVKREQTRVIRIKASIKLADGKVIDYTNLPDIAVAVPVSYADQLFYLVPLHRLAGKDRAVQLIVNDDQTSSQVPCDGMRKIQYDITGPGANDAYLTSMHNGRPLRHLAQLRYSGAKAYRPGDPDHSIVLRPRPEGEEYIDVDWRPSETTAGEDYYAALVRFEDGTWAYSPTIWTDSSLADPQTVSAAWVFAPKSKKEKTKIPDRSGHNRELNIKTDKSKGLKFTSLPGGCNALAFDGKSVLTGSPLTGVSGPTTVEVVFSPQELNRKQVLCYQRGAQAALMIDAQGYLIGQRLPELRDVTNLFATVRSKAPLEKGRFYDAILAYDGRELSLYLNGKLQGKVPCRGSRSCEGYAIGGPMGGGDRVTKAVDEMPGDSFFKGLMVRLAIFADALDAKTIASMHERNRIMPFWK